MRTFKLLLSSLVLTLAAAPALGRAETKIGVFEWQRAVNEIDEAKAASALLQKEHDDRQAKFLAKQDEFQKLKDEYTKQQSVMNDATRKEKETELQKRFLELQQLGDTLDREMAAKNEELRKPLQSRLDQVVKEVAESEGLSLVVDRGALVYMAPSLDITNEVIRRYNTKYPRKPGAAGAPADKAAAKPASGDKPAPKTK
jgi:outer membrane protein